MNEEKDETTDERLRRDQKAQTPLKWLGMGMAILFVCLAAWIYFYPAGSPGLPADSRNLLAGLLAVYGVYRGWRAWSMYFSE